MEGVKRKRVKWWEDVGDNKCRIVLAVVYRVSHSSPETILFSDSSSTII